MSLGNGSRGCQHLIRPSPDADIFSEVFPAHGTGTIQQELCRAGNIVPLGTSTMMQQREAADNFRLRIAEKRKREACLVA